MAGKPVAKAVRRSHERSEWSAKADGARVHLVLFDIDGTLVLTGRAGVRGMNLAFGRLHGHDRALDQVAIAGRTDRAIVMDAMRGIGVEPHDAAIRALHDAYIELLGTEIHRPAPGHPSRVLPGVTTLLDRLERQPGVTTGLLTGNFQRGAAVKLSHFDLWRRFGFGAFGDEHVDRRALVPVAMAAARDAGADLRATSVVIVGDTPHDIDCAKAHGARALGVATGPFSEHDLREAGADLTLPTLEAVERVMEWMLG